MNIQIKKHKAQCMLYAFAMVLNTDADDLISIIGHDGTEIVFPDYAIPMCYKGFHPAEMTYACTHVGYTCMAYPFKLLIGRDDVIHEISAPYSMVTLLKYNNGILLTDGHAYAWDRLQSRIVDPDNGTFQFMNPDLIIQMKQYKCFYAVMPQSILSST